MIGSNFTTEARELTGVTGLDQALQRPDPSAMAPPGFIVVRAYTRNAGGKSVLVHSHVRRLRGKHRDRLLDENLLFMFWNSGKSYPPLKDVFGFQGKGRSTTPLSSSGSTTGVQGELPCLASTHCSSK